MTSKFRLASELDLQADYDRHASNILSGISLRGETKLPPAFMIKRFGKHDGGDGIRSSGGWDFVGESGEVFTVYEWRCTTLSNGRGSGSPTVRQFWGMWEPVKLHIGGRPD